MESVKHKLCILQIYDILGFAIWALSNFEILICSVVRESRGFVDRVLYLTAIRVAFTKSSYLSLVIQNKLGSLSGILST